MQATFKHNLILCLAVSVSLFAGIINRNPPQAERTRIQGLIDDAQKQKSATAAAADSMIAAMINFEFGKAIAWMDSVDARVKRTEEKFNKAIRETIKAFDMDTSKVKGTPSTGWMGDAYGVCRCDSTVFICIIPNMFVFDLVSTLKHELTHANTKVNGKIPLPGESYDEARARREVEAYDAQIDCSTITQVPDWLLNWYASAKYVYALQYKAATEDKSPPAPFDSVEAKWNYANALYDSLTNSLKNRQAVVDSAHAIMERAKPLSQDGQIVPEGGNEEDEIRYSVVYTDRDNDPPAYVDVWIDEHAYPMQKVDPFDMDYTDGCEYEYITTLPAGKHTYHFRMSDWLGYSRFPSEGVLEGPIIRKTVRRIGEKKFLFGFGLQPGYAFWSLDDFQTSEETYDRYDAVAGWDASAKSFSGSADYSANILGEFQLSPCHIIGLSVGYELFPGGTLIQSFDDNVGYTSTINLELSAYTIPVNVFYKMKVTSTPFFLNFSAGIDFYRVAADYNWTYSEAGEEDYLRGKLRDSGAGVHTLLGAEYHLSKNISLSINAGYAFAKLNNLTGKLSDHEGNREKTILTMIEEPGFGKSVWMAPADEPLEPNMRAAELDFSGWKFTVGIIYLFSCH